MKNILIQLILGLFLISVLPAQSEDKFEHPEWEFQEIPNEEYYVYQFAYFAKIRNQHPFKDLGLVQVHSCDEICESYLKDPMSQDSMYLPSNYDAGLLVIAHSISGNAFLLYSAYDGPDYGEYYDYRSEIIAYKLSGEEGLSSIKPWFSWTTGDWSIEELIWIDADQIGMKIY
mgnify:CR=1 FL=1